MKSNNKLPQIPLVIYHYIFDFLNAIELKNNLRVSKELKKINETIISKTKEQLFYLIGMPLLIGDHTNSSGEESIVPRKKITIHEFKKSFPKSEKVKLFRTEEEALDYSRYLRTDTDVMNTDHIYQSGIFKVQYIKKVIPESKEEVFTIKNYVGLPLFYHPCRLQSKKLNKKSKLMDSKEYKEGFTWNTEPVILDSFEADAHNLIPQFGIFKIDFKDENKFKEYCRYDFKDEKEKSFFSKCSIM